MQLTDYFRTKVGTILFTLLLIRVNIELFLSARFIHTLSTAACHRVLMLTFSDFVCMCVSRGKSELVYLLKLDVHVLVIYQMLTCLRNLGSLGDSGSKRCVVS